MYKKIKHDLVYKFLGSGIKSHIQHLKIAISAKDQRLTDEVSYALTNFPHSITKIVDCDVLITDNFSDHLIRRLAGRSSILIDRNLFRASDAIRLRDLQWFLMSHMQKNEEVNIYAKNFESMVNNVISRKSTIIAPGPSYNSLRENAQLQEIRDSNIIICNSVVKDINTLNTLGKVDVLCFSDPVFHFSSSEYCLQFINDVKKVIENFNPYIIVPISAAPLTRQILLSNNPKVIGYQPSNEYIIPHTNTIAVKYSPNVLTSLLLPTAACLSDNIYTIGCDGREKNEKYFWKHNKSAQYTDLMHTVFEKHPSFLNDQNLDYYYKQHVERLTNDVKWLRSQGKTIKSLTPTFLDILK